MTDGKSSLTYPRSVFTIREKQLGRKLLLDYRAVTGKGWSRILSEIARVTNLNASVASPVIVRQDLESWAAEVSVLGDAKFRVVFDFLTHPDTLKRPEFERARGLLGPNEYSARVSGTLAEFYSDSQKVPFHIMEQESTYGRSPEDNALRMKPFCTIWRRQNAPVYLKLSMVTGENFLRAQQLTFTNEPQRAEGDLHCVIDFGIVTLGRMTLLHIRNALSLDARNVPIYFDKGNEYLTVFSDLLPDIVDVKSHWAHRRMQDRPKYFPAADAELHSYIAPWDYCYRYIRSENKVLEEIFDSIIWSMPN